MNTRNNKHLLLEAFKNTVVFRRLTEAFKKHWFSLV